MNKNWACLYSVLEDHLVNISGLVGALNAVLAPAQINWLKGTVQPNELGGYEFNPR